MDNASEVEGQEGESEEEELSEGDEDDDSDGFSSEEDEEEEEGKNKKQQGKAAKVARDGSDTAEGRTVFIRNVPFTATEEDIKYAVDCLHPSISQSSSLLHILRGCFAHVITLNGMLIALGASQPCMYAGMTWLDMCVSRTWLPTRVS